jgi:uncharacterized damage-inducible protein DinB
MTTVAAVAKTNGAALAAEFREEAKTTRRALERVPGSQLGWKPHAKSLSLGQLALHIAAVPGRLVLMLEKTEQEITPASFQFEEPHSADQILAVFDRSVNDAGAYLAALSEPEASAEWSVKSNGRTVFRKSRLDAIRTIMLSHVYHHRGQLSVYLRLLDVSVPSVYGPSADENPFV